MADGAVNFLLDKLTIILGQEASLLGNAQDGIEEIKRELESMKFCLKDAEQRKEMSESVEAWVRQLREVVYEVEDIIDEFMYNKDWGQHGSGYKGFVQDVISLPKKMTSKHHISSKLQKIKGKVHEVSERSKRYAFVNIDEERNKNAACDRWQRHRESSIFVEDDDIVGMKENAEKLLEWLTDNEPRQTIISILGMGGLGKTTLVTQVYNDPLIKRHFECWAWISVSQAYDLGDLLRGMIKQLVDTKQVIMLSSNLGSMYHVELLGMLIDLLHQKRYIIVLDDVWSIELWGHIRGAFPRNKHGSRIILTTRNENVPASVGIGSRVYRLDPLRDDDAWTLFCKKAFWNNPEDRTCPRELRALAQAIANKCQGLPLAIVAIGGLMSSRNRTVIEWKKVYDSLNWQLSNNPLLERVKGILLLSFKDLPYYLKHCFLHCCVFRDGYPIKRKKLIRLWVAEGFITQRKGMTMEEVAEEYLAELIFRSMIQAIETNDAGRVKTCRVHDVMLELAMTTCEKENFCTAYDGRETRLEGKIHRISLYNRGENVKFSSTTSRHLRSFFVYETGSCSSFSLDSFSSKFKYLRLLELEGVLIETVPDSLLDLFNLRYLNLRETNVRELPKSMERLMNLQTLDVRNTNIERLPSGISKLQKLRHLYMYRDNTLISGTSKLTCGMQAPKGICNVRSLQTLACIEAEEELINQVQNLTELRRLEITKLKAADGSKLCASIARIPNLQRLGITSVTEEEELQLEDLSQPPLFLQKLTLVGRLDKLPHWIGPSLANISHLYLGSSQLEEENLLPSLHLLSTLVFLELKKAYNGKLLVFKAGWFPKLNRLNLLELQRLSIMKVEENALANIKEVRIIRCPELEALPEGIEHLTCLQKLHLEEMSQGFVQRLHGDLQTIQRIRTINHVYLTGQNRVVETL